ncbi:MAG: YhcH/YjgK/YiaL family protein [Planctomycetes bacterium]|jgi:YhcH/YjgK/YiaL family protein|nr:YhcH/YjgK/YiaL family protein [Planctomycetota bacterium]
MIVDRIENAHLYASLHKQFQNALAVLADPATARKPDGRHDLDGDDLYFMIQRYVTKPVDQTRFESHKKYIDIQALLAGRELLGYVPTAGLEITVPYDESKDIMFYRAGAMTAQVRLEPGVFCILYPQDAHLPSCQIISPSEVHKIVFKIRV